MGDSCAQRDASSGWSSLYPSFWSSFFAKPSPILEMAVDADRGILYTRSENSALQVTPVLQQQMNTADDTGFIAADERSK